MNKLIYGIAVATVVLPTLAMASPGDDGCIGNCPNNGGGNGPVDVSQQQQQQQAQSQESTNVNKNYNDSTAVAGAISGSSADSTATGIGVGGSSTVGVAVKTGPTVSGSFSNAEGGKGGDGGNAHASGGDAYAKGGDSSSRSYSEGSVAGASVGDVTSRSGDSSAYSGGNSQSTGVSIADNSVYSVEYQEAAARAATVFAEVCMNGGSAQAQAGGFGIQNQDVVCEHLKIAAVMRDAYVFEMQYGVYEECTHDEEKHEVHCTNEMAEFYRGAYHEHMTEAIQAMEMYEEVGLLDKISGALVRPLALIGALIWLI